MLFFICFVVWFSLLSAALFSFPMNKHQFIKLMLMIIMYPLYTNQTHAKKFIFLNENDHHRFKFNLKKKKIKQ